MQLRNISLSIIFLISGIVCPAVAPTHAAGMEANSPSEADECANVFNAMNLEGVVNYKAFRQAMAGYKKIKNRKKDILTLIDFSKPSTQERLYVFDMKHKRMLFSSLVSHGRNSGENYATSF